LGELFSRQNGAVTNYDTFENYYWIWRFLNFVESRIGQTSDAPFLPNNASDIKLFASLLFNASIAGGRIETLSDVFNPKNIFILNNPEKALPEIEKSAAKAFLGESSFSREIIAKYGLDRGGFSLVSKLVRTLIPPKKVVPTGALNQQQIECLWMQPSATTKINLCTGANPPLFDISEDGSVTENGNVIGKLKAIAILKYFTGNIPDSLDDATVKIFLRSYYLAVKYSVNIFNNSEALSAFKKDIHQSVATLLSSVKNDSDKLIITGFEKVSESKIGINNADEKNFRIVPYIEDIAKMAEEIKISIPSATFNSYTLDAVSLETVKYAAEAKDNGNGEKPQLIIKESGTNKIFVKKNISKDLFLKDISGRKSARLNAIFPELADNISDGAYIEIKVTALYTKNNKPESAGRNFEAAYDFVSSLPAESVAESLVESGVNGRVLFEDSTTSSPLENAAVIMEPGNNITYTDSLGRFVFTSLSSGYYDISVEKDGFLPVRTSFILKEGEEKTLETILTITEPSTDILAIVQGIMKDSQTNQELTGVLITLRDGTGRLVHTEELAKGAFYIPEIGAGTYILNASKKGYYKESRSFIIKDSSADLGDILLVPALSCGNREIENGEICDTNSEFCEKVDGTYSGGMAYCNETCSGWDTSKCEKKQALCGNGKVDSTAKEVCDTGVAAVSCKTLSANYLDSTATCKNDCSGFVLTDCIDSTGIISEINFETSFIYNADFIDNPIYFESNSGAMKTPAFIGTLLQSQIPEAQATETVAYSALDLSLTGSFPEINIYQKSYFNEGNSLYPTGYQIVAKMPASVISGDTISVGLDAESFNLFVLSNSYGEIGGSYCVAAVGFGKSLSIPEASNTTSPGGSIKIQGSSIKLFAPDYTPDGDVRKNITELTGYSVCSPNQVCGNGVVENYEQCDGAETISCTEINGEIYKSGNASCVECQFDTSLCVMAIKGSITSFYVGDQYIVDGDRISDPDYYGSVSSYISKYPFFYGTIENENIPLNQSTSIDAYAAHSKSGIVYISQRSKSPTENIWQRIMLIFTNDLIDLEPKNIGLASSSSKLIVTKIQAAGDITEECIDAVAEKGTLTVTKAENTTQTEGGKISLSKSGIKPIYLYRPDDVNGNDMSDYLSKLFDGKPICK